MLIPAWRYLFCKDEFLCCELTWRRESLYSGKAVSSYQKRGFQAGSEHDEPLAS